MRLDLTETFADVPARRVRDALRRSDSRWVTPFWLARAANCPDDRAEDLVDALVSRRDDLLTGPVHQRPRQKASFPDTADVRDRERVRT